MNDKPLRDKVAVVTGAGRRIGREIAIAYARAGASIACAARTRADIDETARIIVGEGGKAAAIEADVTDLDSVTRLFQTAAAEFGGVDIAVINAGGNYDRGRSVEMSDPDAWRRTLEVNLVGAYYTARAAIPHLKARGSGKIITLGSGVGHRSPGERSAYACSKAGLWMLTRVLAQELAADSISVNELIPGPVTDTPPQLGPEAEWVKRPEDVVPLALFLATQPAVGPTAQSFSLMRRDN